MDAAPRFLKRSTRPAVSKIFSLPVKKGWQWLHISMFRLSFVDPTEKEAPQAQETLAEP